MQVKGLCYRPDLAGKKLVTAWDERQKLNVFRDGPVTPVKGDPTPWLRLLERMFPVEEERHFQARICATLAAKLGVSMHCAVLMVSQLQGTGKSTLMKIMKYLVGAHNTSEPTASEIVDSDWNDWLPYKRLSCVHEIYEGQSWKAYQKIKGYITEDTIRACIRYEDGYDVENFITFFFGSNSMGALKMEDNDRRIFAPTVTEAPWDKTEARDFYAWLEAGGLRIIKQWALDFGNGEGEYLPSHCDVLMTQNKKEMIDASKPEMLLYAEMIMMSMQREREPVNWVLQAGDDWLIETIKQGELKPVAIGLADAFDRAKEQHKNDFTSKMEFRKEMTKGPHGLVYLDQRMKVKGRLTRVLLNDTAKRAIERNRNCFYSAELKAFRSKEGKGETLPINEFAKYINAIIVKAHEIQEWKLAIWSGSEFRK